MFDRYYCIKIIIIFFFHSKTWEKMLRKVLFERDAIDLEYSVSRGLFSYVKRSMWEESVIGKKSASRGLFSYIKKSIVGRECN